MAAVVSGPDLPDGRKADSASVGLSVAVTYASRASRAGRAETYYVRDLAGELVGRADADGGGSVEVFGQGTINAYRVAQLPLPDRADRTTDRAPTSDTGASLVGGPSGSSRGLDQEVAAMAETPKTRKTAATAKSGAAATKGAAKTPTTTKRASRAKQAAPAEDGAATGVVEQEVAPAVEEPKGENGSDLMAALMRSVEEKIPQAEPKTNPSGTSTRLVLPNGKSFAVVFPPRKSGLAVKIPKHLLGVEGELPDGHGFHRVGWGLSRTMTTSAEAPAVAAAFAVAAQKLAAAPAGAGDGES